MCAVQIVAIISKIRELETRASPRRGAEIGAQLDALAASHTHVYALFSPLTFLILAHKVRHSVPYYDLLSKPGGSGRLARAAHWVRTLLIEDVYQRLRTSPPPFPPPSLILLRLRG